MANLFELNGITAFSEQKNPLSVPHFSVKPGEVHAFVGAHSVDLLNLFEFLQGRDVPYEGEVRFRGETTNLATLIGQNKLDYLTHKNCLFPGFTVMENIYIKEKKQFWIHKTGRYRQCAALCEKYGIQLNLHEDVYYLPKEDGKFVELLGLCVINPDVIILFDTMNYIYNEKNATFVRILSDFRREGKGIIYLTSKFEDALRISDRISLISDGKMTRTFLTKKVSENPKEFMYAFLGYENENPMGKGELEMFESIIEGTGIITSNHELGQILAYFEKNILDIMRADYCSITLQAEAAGNFGGRDPQEVVSAEGKQVLLERLSREKIVIFSRQDAPTAGYLSNPSINMLVSTAIQQGGKLAGSIQVGYHSEHHLHKNDRLFLNTFSQELLIAIETSRLMGRSVLLQESHHRIKNNLQVIISLLYMQKHNLRKQGAANCDDVIDSIVGRVKSIAVVHDLLTGDRLGSSIINLGEIIEEIAKFYTIPQSSIRLDLESVNIPYNKMISVTLVINELLSNCVKHAFTGMPDSHQKDVRIACTSEADHIAIVVEDNGNGLPDGFDFAKCQSTGMHIVKFILMDLHGTPTFQNSEQGARVEIRLPKVNLYASAYSGDKK